MKFKTILFSVMTTCWSLNSYSQIGIGTTSPDKSSIMDISSIDKGLLIPRLTNNQVDSISNPANGLIVFNSTVNTIQINVGTMNHPIWSSLSVNGNSTVQVLPELSGFIGTLSSNEPALNTKFKIAFINNSFNDVGMELSSNDISFDGISGLSVSNISDPYPWLSQGDTISIEYEITGVPQSSGEIICSFQYKGMVLIESINISE